MRKSFYQMLQLIEANITNQHNLNQYDNFNIRQILNSIEDEEQKKIISVKLALYCAEDCFDFNNDQTKPAATICITKVKSWLIDPNSVTQQDLLNAAYTAAAANAAWAAVNAAYGAAWAASYVAEDAAFYATHAARNAIYAYYYANDQNENIRQQKESEYKSYLLNLIHNYHSHITFDNDYDYQSLQQELPNRNNPSTWNSDQWFYYLLKLKDQNNMPFIVQHNNQWIINPNLGNYNIETDTQEELINIIAENPQFKDLRLKLANI